MGAGAQQTGAGEGRPMRRALPTALALLFVLVPLPARQPRGRPATCSRNATRLFPGAEPKARTSTGQPPFAGANNCGEPGGSIFIVQQGEAASSSAFWNLPMPAPPGGEHRIDHGHRFGVQRRPQRRRHRRLRRAEGLVLELHHRNPPLRGQLSVRRQRPGLAWLRRTLRRSSGELGGRFRRNRGSTRWRPASTAWAGRCSKVEFSTVTRRPAPWPQTKVGASPR